MVIDERALLILFLAVIVVKFAMDSRHTAEEERSARLQAAIKEAPPEPKTIDEYLRARGLI